MASSQWARSRVGARSRFVPIAGTLVKGVTATGSSTSGDCPRRQGARASGR